MSFHVKGKQAWGAKQLLLIRKSRFVNYWNERDDENWCAQMHHLQTTTIILPNNAKVFQMWKQLKM
jgi:hypothetical protein